MSTRITTEITIGAPAYSVWGVLTDFSRYPDWNPFILKVRGAVQEKASVKYRFEFPPGFRMWATAKVLSFKPEKELRWAAHFLTPALFNGDHYFVIEQVSENSVSFHHGEIFTGLLTPLALPLLRIYGRRVYQGLNNALKERVESRFITMAAQ